MVNVKITIESDRAMNPHRTAPPGEEDQPPGPHQQGGDWLIQIIDPNDPNQSVLFEYRGPAQNHSFQLQEGDAYHVRVARLDTDGVMVGGALMLTDYVVGSGDVPAIAVPTAIAISK